MKTISKQIILNTCFLLLGFAVVNITYAASAVKQLNLKTIKGKPGIPFRADIKEMIRLMELLVIGKTPDSVPIEQLVYLGSTAPSQDYALCALAVRHLTVKERAKVITKASCNAGKRNWAGRHKLDREDSKKIFKQKYLPQIKKAAAKVASHKGFREIIIIGPASVRPDDYSREKGGFKFRFSLGYGIPMLSVADVKSIDVWKMTEAKARQLMDGMLATKQGQVFQVETIIELGGVKKVSYKGRLTRHKIIGRIKSVTLYANADKSLSKPLHRFTKEDYTDMAGIAASKAQAREQARLANLEKIKFADSKYFIAAYADLSGKGLKLVDEIFANKRYSGNPFEIKKQKNRDHDQMKKILKQALARFDRNKKVWVSGAIVLKPYNIAQSYFPLHKTTVYARENNRDEKAQWVRVQLVTSQIGKLPVPVDIAKRMTPRQAWRQGAHAGAFRALVKPVNALEPGRTLELAVERLELLKTNQHIDILDDKNVIWSYTPPSYKKLMAKVSQGKANELDEIAQQKKVCAASKDPVSCYPKLCERIRKAEGKKKWESCMQETKLAIRKWKKSQWATINAKRDAKDENIRQSMVTEKMCRRKYTGYVVQPWMPVKGTPEFKSAMTACQNEPVRDVYGPDILGLRLGMSLNDANNFIRRQSVKQNTTLKDTRPFEKAALHWTKDANHGIAVFSVVNGEHERVAAVSRRLYMGDKKMTAGQVISGLRKKYGRELWSNGNQTLLWAFSKGSKKPSAKMCSGLVKLIEPRSGWNRTWGPGKKSSKASKQRQSTSMARVGRQQECMAKHGMPSSPATMQVFASCMQGLTTNASAPSQSGGKSGVSARLPFMIKASGNPKLYARYKACGPVVIARINKGRKGVLTDMSLVLFDPDWIARQPAFAFRSGKGESRIAF